MKKLFLAMPATETNTFSPLPTGWNIWRDTVLRRRKEHDPTISRGQTVYAPLFARLDAGRWILAPGLQAFAAPAGPTPRAVYKTLRDEFFTLRNAVVTPQISIEVARASRRFDCRYAQHSLPTRANVGLLAVQRRTRFHRLMPRWYPSRGRSVAVAIVLWLAGSMLAPVLRAETLDDPDTGVLTTEDGSETRIRYAESSYTGIGRFVWGDGRSYSGDFVSGHPHGRGIEQQPDGTSYDGEWIDGQRGGTGTATFADGSRYDGQFAGGVRSGLGLFQSAAGRYQGSWIEDVPQGEGRFDYSDGASYEGFWLGGRRNGFGTYHRNDGSSYEGDWADDVPDGYGRLLESNDYSYEGGWRAGQRAGYGAMRVGESFGYEGTWAANVRQGYGRESRPDGSQYTGEWRDDQRNGLGTLRMSNGASYEGYWQHNATVGPGTRVLAEGTEITGTWDGAFVARGILRLRSGDAYEGGLYNPATKAVDSGFLEWLEYLANGGNPDAALLLGHAHRYYLQPAPDRTQASLWYDRAAQAGLAEAQYQLATILLEESGSIQPALQLLLSASAQGHAAANTRLGLFYQQGTYVETDHAKALRYYEAAIVEGDLTARNNLAWLLATSPTAALRDGKRAITLAQPLVVLHRSWRYLDTLAAAEAEAGDFAEAARTEQRAIAEAETGANEETLLELERRLTLFQRAEPYREP